METIKGYKGFRPDMTCQPDATKPPTQFAEGGEYQVKKVKCCKEGFHFCEYPLDVFSYYPPNESVYAEVAGDGDVDRKGDDTKVCVSRLKVKAKINLLGIAQAAVKYITDHANSLNKTEHATGDQSAASATGDRSAASATGYRSAASATGYQSAASATGDRSAASATGDQSAASATGYRSAASVERQNSIACGLGIESKAKGVLGSWIVLAEWVLNGEQWEIKTVQTTKVDGESIKPDTWYKLKDNQFVEEK